MPFDEVSTWALPTNFGEALTWAPVRILFIVLLALVARLVSHKLVTSGVRQMVRVKVHARALSPLLIAERREQRMTALGSMTRAVLTAVIGFIAMVMVLDELGFNVTTIIAGTSVVGVAFAFGLQSIVKDFVSGLFMLAEDQLGVGDYVDLDKASGTVAAVGLRVTQLRDDNGNMWYVRNGEVLRVGNFSQGGSHRPVVPEGGAWTLSYSPAKAKPEVGGAVVAPDPAPPPPEADDAAHPSGPDSRQP